MKITPWEREINHIATGMSPQPRWRTTPSSSWEAATTMMEAVASMEMAPGALPRPGKVPKQRLLSPELGFLVAVELRSFSGEIDDCFVSFMSGAIYSPKGVARRCTRRRHHTWGRLRPNRAQVWCGGCGPPPNLSFWLPESSGVLEFL